jgi:uncharacterized protein
MQLKDLMKNIPFLGTGIGFRPEIKSFIFLNRDKIGFLEIIAEHYIDVPDEKFRELELLKKHFTIIPHAINLSLGSAEGIDLNYLQKLKNIIEYLDPPYWSEHISYTRAHGIDAGHLSPCIFNNAFLDVLNRNIQVVNKHIKHTLILENITYHVELPGREYGDAAFLNKLCELTGCGLLLDITNLYINSRNIKFDPFRFIDELDTGRVVQLHYVGYEEIAGQIIDTHAARTSPEIFELMSYFVSKNKPKGILLERDERLEETEEILNDLLIAQKLMS